MNVKNHMIPDEASKSTSHCQYIITGRWMGYITKGVTICCSFCKAYKFTVFPCNIIICQVIKIYWFKNCAINISYITIKSNFLFSIINQLWFKKIWYHPNCLSWLHHHHRTIYSCWKGESISNLSIIVFCCHWYPLSFLCERYKTKCKIM